MSSLHELAIVDQRLPTVSVSTNDEIPELEVLHACVPGRIRWHVRGLRGNAALQRLLEDGLADFWGIHRAQASLETGNLLVLFDPVIPADRIAGHIGALVRGEVVPAVGMAGITPDWHASSEASVADRLGTSRHDGLEAAAAQARLSECGANSLPPAPSRSTLEIFLTQFQTLPVGLLAGAAVFSALTGGLLEAAAILGVVAANGVLGTLVESRSEQTIRSLGEAEPGAAQVVRDGVTQAVAPESVVSGDLILLQPGSIVPADARVVAARELRLTEALLTGESRPVTKQTDPVPFPAPLAERASMVYRGTAVTGGSGLAIVVATGPRTEVGRIQRLTGDARTRPTPMQRQLDQLGGQLVLASVAACAVVMGTGLLRGFALFQVVRSGISLAVAAIPEGLPTVATTTLALGIEEMRKRGVIIRRLDAVESLASVGVVCFDKTGTLTLAQMRVTQATCDERHFLSVEDGRPRDEAGEPMIPTEAAPSDDSLTWLLRVAALCSDAELERRNGRLVPVGSGTECALLHLVLDSGLDVVALRADYPRLATRHRSATYRFMATVHERSENKDYRLVTVKGSPPEVLALCEHELRGGKTEPLNEERRKIIAAMNDAMAADALRVLGFAYSKVPNHALTGPDDDAMPVSVGDLTWIGLAGMSDPLRSGTQQLIRTLHDAGLRTVMMTGDQVTTARAVARQLGLSGDDQPDVFDIADLDRLEGDALTTAIRKAHVFARVTPAQKLQLVRALQDAGEHIAMTGDGINDSPALKAADVGIAMGGAASSEAARDIADVVLRTDDLAALASAIERGRSTYINVRKSIRYLLATNFSEILVVLGATAAGIAEPLTPIQLLWINLISDVLPGIGLALEPPEPNLMIRPPNTAQGHLIGDGELSRLGMQGATIAAGSLAALAWGVVRHGAGPQANTMAFGSLVTSQLLHAITARSDRHGLFVTGAGTLASNQTLSGFLLATAVLQALAFLAPPLRGLLGLAPLGPLDLVATAAAGIAPYVLNEAAKSRRVALNSPDNGLTAQ